MIHRGSWFQHRWFAQFLRKEVTQKENQFSTLSTSLFLTTWTLSCQSWQRTRTMVFRSWNRSSLTSIPHSLNVSIEVIEETQEERDIAVVLNGVGYTDDYEGDYTQRRTLIWTLNFTVKTYLFGPVDANKDIRKIQVDFRSDIIRRPAELRYSQEVMSTEEPPKPRDEINPSDRSVCCG